MKKLVDNNTKLGITISVFILLIIGITLLGEVANNTSQTETLTTVTNDTFNMDGTNCVEVRNDNDCIISITAVHNYTAGVSTDIDSTNYSLCNTDGSRDGTLFDGIQMAVAGIDLDDGELNATYSASDNCMYVADSTSRALIPLIVIFFAIALVVGVSIAGFMKLKEDF